MSPYSGSRSQERVGLLDPEDEGNASARRKAPPEYSFYIQSNSVITS